MSRSGYSDDCDGWALIRWRGAVTSAIRGNRGQAFLRDALDALDSMPEKRLIAQSFGEAGSFCTLGAVCNARGVEVPTLTEDDYYEPDEIRFKARQALGITDALAAEIMFLNDEGGAWKETPEQRWARMREWIASQIKEPTP